MTSRSLLRVQANSSTGRFPEVNNIWKRRRDLQGVTLRVPIVLYPHPRGQLEEDGSYTGFSVSATEVMAQVLNFSAKLVVPRDGRRGNRLSDGTWNGMVGMLLSGQADLISPLAHSPDRARVMSFQALPTTQSSPSCRGGSRGSGHGQTTGCSSQCLRCEPGVPFSSFWLSFPWQWQPSCPSRKSLTYF